MKLDELDFKDGLIPVVTQDIRGTVLMQAYANREAVEKTLDSGQAWYWSRSRSELWMKGEESGNLQEVVGMFADCDKDSLLYVVKQKGWACHLGTYSCFENMIQGDKPMSILEEVYTVIQSRKDKRPEGSYVTSIIDDEERLLGKIEEESQELIDAFNGSGDLVWEAADVIFHTFLLLANRDVNWEELAQEFEKRRRK